MMSTLDDEFLQYAERILKEEQDKGKAPAYDYEVVEYAGLEKNKVKIFRFLGGLPGSEHRSATDGKIVNISNVVDDSGKIMRLILPSQTERKDHPIWRIINNVNEVTWINKQKVYVNEKKYPDIFNIINKNGRNPGTDVYKYDRGWAGRNVLLVNVIDREDIEWHRKNKHTKILSRSVVTLDDGRKYAEPGVPVYGFFTLIATTLFKHYGNWENYDIGIERVGSTTTPYKVMNASKMAMAGLPEVPKHLVPLVSLTGLTEEENSWTRYDIDKVFGYTSYTKIYNRLKATIMRIDAKFGTSYLKEIEYEMEKERQAREEHSKEEPISGKVMIEGIDRSITAQHEGSKPVRTRVPSSPATSYRISADKIALLKGWGKLTEEQRMTITDVIVNAKGEVINITYDTTEPLFADPDTGIPAPESFPCDPLSGVDF